MTPSSDDAVTRAQLVAARADVQRQIDILLTPSRSYDQMLNADMIERLRTLLAEIDTQLGGFTGGA